MIGSGRFVDLGGRSLAPAPALALVAAELAHLPAAGARRTRASRSCSRSSPATASSAELGPVLVAVLTQLLALIGNGVWVHLLLLGSASTPGTGCSRRTRSSDRSSFRCSCASSGSARALALRGGSCAPRVHRRRRRPRRGGWQLPARIVAGATVLIAFLALASNWGPAGVTASRLSASFAPTFHRLTLAATAAPRPPDPGDRALSDPAGLQQTPDRIGRPGRLDVHDERVHRARRRPAAAHEHPGRLRRERAIERLLQGVFPARVRRRGAAAGHETDTPSSIRSRSSTAASTCSSHPA